jgi:Flp pilus assembly protein CpaB
MPITTIIILAAIVAAFVLFGVVLAWGEMQTRHLGRDQQRARKSAQASNSVRVIRAKAQVTGATNTSSSREMAPS